MFAVLFFKCQQGTNSLNNEHTSCRLSRAPHNFIRSLLTKLLPDSYYRATARLWCLNRKYMVLRLWFGVVLHLLKRPCKGPVMTKLGVSDRSNVARFGLQLQIACMHRFCNALARPLVFSQIDSRCLQSGSNCRSLRCCDRGSGEPPSTMMSLLDGCENTWENENLIEPQLSTASVFLQAGLQWFNFTLLHPHHTTLSGLMLIFIAAASRWKEQSKTKLLSGVISALLFFLSTEDLVFEPASCWGAQRPPASALEMLHVSPRAAILCQHHQQR